MIKVILTEDHPLVVEGIKAMLDHQPDLTCMATCGSASALLGLLKTMQPDIILMDINLPDTSGIDLCKAVKQLYPAIGVLALSINNHPSVIRQMMDNGADGYLLKDAEKSEIIAAIKAVTKNNCFYSHSVTMTLRNADNHPLPSLTRREREVLELISDGFTNREIAEKLYVDITTVDSHRKNMLAKYNVKNTSALIKLAMINHLL
ncbi:response regulator transcription factor [Arachidicoccus ginsenosidivorans]|nr:response regulator transcription factor [Arachidicoccus ginsenosidivorans]